MDGKHVENLFLMKHVAPSFLPLKIQIFAHFAVYLIHLSFINFCYLLLPKMNLTRNLCNAGTEKRERDCNFLRTLCFPILKTNGAEWWWKLKLITFENRAHFVRRGEGTAEEEVVKPEVKSRSFISFLESSSSSSLPAAVCCS